jgi:hypothetical protein
MAKISSTLNTQGLLDAEQLLIHEKIDKDSAETVAVDILEFLKRFEYKEIKLDIKITQEIEKEVEEEELETDSD